MKQAKSPLFHFFIMAIIAFLIIVFPTRNTMDVSGSSANAYPPPNLTSTPQIGPLNYPYKIQLPIIMTPPPPAPSAALSRYVVDKDIGKIDALGCIEGTNNHSDAIVILDFGHPTVNNSTPPVYGTLFVNYVTSATLAEIEYMAKNYLIGFHRCAPAPVNGVSSVYLTLAIGTNNSGNTQNITSGHAIAWANMIINLDLWIKGSNPPSTSWGYQMAIAGAMDIEPGFNTPDSALLWVDAYNSRPTKFLYNYGSCDGCSYLDHQLTPPNLWTTDDIWYVSYGPLLDFPIPEIYRRNDNGGDGFQAHQWQTLKKWAITCSAPCLPSQSEDRAIYFYGTLTQYDACHDPQNGSECIDDLMDNTPEQGWQLLWTLLNNDPEPWMHQSLRWSTDISWKTQ